jgi:monovalent cation:H+ antiporter-2, CPA2 family
LTPFAGLYVLVMAIIGPVIAVNSERIGALVFRPRRRTTLAPDDGRDRDFALAEAAMAGPPGDDTAALEVAAGAPSFGEVSGVDDEGSDVADERTDEDRLAEQAGAQSDVAERPTRAPDPEY